MSLAHSILQLKNKEDVFALKEKAKEMYEKLSMLAFIEEYINTTPNLEETKEELVAKVEKAFENKVAIGKDEIETTIKETVVHNFEYEYLEGDTMEILEQPFSELETILASEPVQEENNEHLKIEQEEIETPKVEEKAPLTLEEVKEMIKKNNASFANFKNDAKDIGERKTLTLEEELEYTIPVDIMANLFEQAKPKSINDNFQENIQIGLNDRIAFVKDLFNGSQEDFNRVISQLNTLKTEKEAKKFVDKMVKPDYNWSEHEDLEIRFTSLILRKFA
ncbi:MAG: hypothetical protein ACWIPJ_04925 [Polaribacter sp.]